MLDAIFKPGRYNSAKILKIAIVHISMKKVRDKTLKYWNNIKAVRSKIS